MSDARLPYAEIRSKARKNEAEALRLLGEIVRFPSCAARDHRTIVECADHVEAQLRERTNGFLEETMKKRGKVAVGLAFATESIERTGGYSSDIAEIAINLTEGQ